MFKPGIKSGGELFAAKFGSYECAKFLIEKGADVNKKSDKGLTALAIANETNNSEMSDLLIAAGASKS